MVWIDTPKLLVSGNCSGYITFWDVQGNKIVKDLNIN